VYQYNFLLALVLLLWYKYWYRTDQEFLELLLPLVPVLRSTTSTSTRRAGTGTSSTTSGSTAGTSTGTSTSTGTVWTEQYCTSTSASVATLLVKKIIEI
jgi:hypothetical protein